MTPYNDHVLLKKIVKEKPKNAILTIGNHDENEPEYQIVNLQDVSKLTIGSIVYVKKYQAQPVKIDDIQYHICKIEDIYGVKNG